MSGLYLIIKYACLLRCGTSCLSHHTQKEQYIDVILVLHTNDTIVKELDSLIGITIRAFTIVVSDICRHVVHNSIQWFFVISSHFTFSFCNFLKKNWWIWELFLLNNFRHKMSKHFSQFGFSTFHYSTNLYEWAISSSVYQKVEAYIQW